MLESYRQEKMLCLRYDSSKKESKMSYDDVHVFALFVTSKNKYCMSLYIESYFPGLNRDVGAVAGNGTNF